MQALQIFTIIGLVIAALAAITVWTIVFVEYRKIRKQKKINKLLDRILERAEDSGNESNGDTEELYTLTGVDYDLFVNDNL
uniref:Protein Vpu n=1 Tax=Human immunodeficiency virus type 1 TaxID=11676 RepID=A0A6C0N178_HV1|nr:vpu protein [Human immunodeficiency virus 1]